MREIPQKYKEEFLPMMLDASQTQERHVLLLIIRWVWVLGSRLMPCAQEFRNPSTYVLIENQTIQKLLALIRFRKWTHLHQQLFPSCPCSWLIWASALLAVIRA